MCEVVGLIKLTVCLPLGSQSPYTNHGARTSASHCLPADTHFTQVTHHETPSLHCVLHTLFESTTASLSDQSASPKPFIKAPRGFFVSSDRPQAEFPSAFQDSLCVCILFVHPQSLPAPEPPRDQLHLQHLSHVLHALQTSGTTFKHNADTVSTL